MKKELELTSRNLKSSPMFHLSLSSKELFHSNFLSWLASLAKENGGKEYEAFKNIMKNCFGYDLPDKWDVKREYKNLDFCITADDNIAFVLENKVKSMPRKEQLDEYAERTPFCKKRILLSLATDFPCKEELKKESEEKRKWEIVDYKRYSKALQDNLQYFQSYHADIIRDYSIYIEQLHNLTEEWALKTNDLYKRLLESPFENDDLRLNDLYFKLSYSWLTQEIKKSLSNEGNAKYGIYIDGIKEVSKDNEPIYKAVEDGGNDIFVNAGFTRAQGFFEFKIKVTKNYCLGIQIQGRQYRHLIEWIKNGSQNRDEYWNDTQNETRANDILFLSFDENAKAQYPECLPKENKRSSKHYCKYGDRFLYQYTTITDDTTIEQIINAVVIDARRIIDAYKQNNCS
jgi:hypothetical protein